MGTKSKEFFDVKPVADTLALLFEHLQTPISRTETVPVPQALGRTLATGAPSPENLPAFTRSTMDGYAVRAADTFGASQSLPAYLDVIEPVLMGQKPTQTVHPGQAAPIHTGGMLPEGADAVVMIERTQPIEDDEIEVLAPVAPGENLVQIGEDVHEGQDVLPVGHTIRPQDIGGLLAVGIMDVTVFQKPVISIMGSGNEIVSPSETPEYGQIRDINSYTLAALFTQAGAEVNHLGIAEDTYDAIFEKAKAGIDNGDLLVMTAGSSVSTRDYTRDAMDALGSPGVLQHGLAVKPGKPGLVAACDGKPVIGLPGNPVSAMLVARQLVNPVIRRLLGQTTAPRPMGVYANLTANIASTSGREDTVPVKLIKRGGTLYAEPIFGKSNLIFTLVNADGLVTVPLNSNGLKAGTDVQVISF